MAPSASAPRADRAASAAWGVSSKKLGTKEVPRLRLGIGRPSGRMDPAAYVLQNFSREELKSLSEILDRGVEAVFTFVEHGLNKAMNDFNGGVKE
jgi:peptidyl-tRNA hydrolase, PTH1 family